MQSAPALPGHALFLLLLQIVLILAVSRPLAELMKRLGQPTVLGELLAGIVLGPSLLGWVSPTSYAHLFPADAANQFLQPHLLEVVSWIGMVLLLFLTGLETDVRLLRHLGRSALFSSAFGMVIPFVCGFALGMFTPAEFLANPDRRVLFSLFLATAMSISAMPVIAKILMDLELTKRNIGVVILSAGVVDDTTGWLILSLIAGLAGAHQAPLLQFVSTLILTGAFLAASFLVFHPLARWSLRWIDQKARSANTDLAFIVAFAFLLAAITEAIHIHAVFGAFVAGCILRQVPSLRPATLHRLEAVAVSIFAPVFFGLVGLKVDLKALGSPRELFIVLGVATAGKLIGCTWGGLVGRMTFWESFSIGVAMNARGAMELVVALIGLTLGILNPAMYAIIVVMAVVTSFMAPLGLRLTLRKVKLTPEEQARMASEAQRGLFDKTRLKALLPTAGGPNALVAGRIATALTRGTDSMVSLLYVESPELGIFRRLWRRIRPDQAGKNLQQHLDLVKGFATEHGAQLEVRRVTEPDTVGYICKEAAQHGFDLIFLGAGVRNPLRSAVTARILEEAPCHVAIVRGHGPVADYKQILVCTDGSFFSRAAVELALVYAEQVGAVVTVLYSMEGGGENLPDDDGPSLLDSGFRRMMATTLLTTLSPLMNKTTARVNVIVREADQPTLPVLTEARTGLYQLLIVGSENRAVQHQLSVGYDVERLVREAPCSVVVVVPRIASGSSA
jgi:Kef-type K+ transport system membrane component KefB/nucleotide-binding universal stress UspA family protein